MFKILFKTSIRNILRNGGNSIINFVSLTIGLSISIVIYTIIDYQYSFDHHHTNADRVYRINYTEQQEWGIEYGSQTPEPLHKILRSDYPQIEAVSRTVGPMETNIFIGESKFAQPYILFIDQYFTQLFDQEWIIGDPKEVFKDPRAVVLTESTAEKLFGDQDPIGKTINFRRRVDGIVRGLIKDPQMNTNLPFYMLAHIDMMKQVEEFYVRDSWGVMSIGTTWVLLPEQVNPESLAVQMDDILVNNLGQEAADVYGFELGALKKLHTEDKYSGGVNYTIPSQTVYGLLLIGAIILVTCCINFVNLSTAQALKRAKEVGVKKILGSSRIQLAKQFFLELGLITAIAAFFSLWFAEILLHQVNVLLSMISLDLSLTWQSVGFTFLLVIIVTAAAGFYPTAVLIRFNPAQAIRSMFSQRKGGSAFIRNGLLSIQFVFAQILLIVVLAFNSQFDYIQTVDLGYRTDNVMMFRNFVPGWEPSDVAISSAKTQLMENPNIEMVSFGTGGPNAIFPWSTTVEDPSNTINKEVECDYKLVEIEYKDLFDLNVVAGSWFTPSSYKDTLNKIVITELMVEKFGWNTPEEAIGKRLITNGRQSSVVGVIADFHSDDLRSEIRPSVFESNKSGWSQGFIKYREGTFSSIADHFESVATRTNPDYTPNYIDFSEELALDYEIDKLIFKFINFTAMLAIVIGCLGLYSLISYIAQQKTKEIGIRKVIGADIKSLMIMLSSKFVLLMLLASIVAAPFGYLLADLWLEGFAYRTVIGPAVFIIAFVGTVIIAIGSISHRAFKAATINPVKSLRYE